MNPREEHGDREIIVVLAPMRESYVRKKFHCSMCGNIVFEFYDELRIILPGHPVDQRPKYAVQCPGRIEEFDPIRNQTVRYRCSYKYYLS